MDRDIDIKAIRAKLGLTQAQLGEAVGVDQSTVSNWERDGAPSGPARILLLQLFKDAIEHCGPCRPFHAPGGDAENNEAAA